MSLRPVGRAAIAAISLAVIATAVPTDAQAHRASPHHQRAANAAAAARWQGSQLTMGRIHTSGFDDWGLTIDSAFALVADGAQPRRLHRVANAIERNYFGHYAVFQGDVSAGAMSKSLLAARVLGKSPRHFGGHNVRRQVLRLIAPATAGFEAGRARDTGKTDYSNTLSQAYAVLGLARSGGVSRRAVGYLVKQQCAKGYFRTFEVIGKTCDASSSKSDVDATALGIQALVAAKISGTAVPRHALQRATRWLVGMQRRGGGFGGGSVTRAVNSNSTGLAIQALAAVHHRGLQTRAARYVASLQITRGRAGHGPARRDIGAVAYNAAALTAALHDGITSTTRDQFRRATSQAIFAFVPKPLNKLRVR
jgi:hypothetical protein